jgi:hypothetical protein
LKLLCVFEDLRGSMIKEDVSKTPLSCQALRNNPHRLAGHTIARLEAKAPSPITVYHLEKAMSRVFQHFELDFRARFLGLQHERVASPLDGG